MSMMMSLFSPVEALCAESIGHKLGFSFATVSKADHENRAPQPDRKASAAAAASVPSSSPVVQGIMNMGVASRSSSSPSPPQPSNFKKTKTPMMQKRPRFAPELDGVFCFETIVPY